MNDMTPVSFWEDDRYTIFPNGEIVGPSQKVLRPRPNAQGYLRISFVKDGKNVDQYIHRLVCQAFHGPPPSKIHQVDHRNECRSDNNYTNLRWLTKSENLSRRSPILGSMARNSKLNESDIRMIRTSRHYRGFDGVMAKRLGVARETVRDVRNGKDWIHVR